jgi:glucan phosphoethanolaminetransferase (alkaline phosphatase superfamily)
MTPDDERPRPPARSEDAPVIPDAPDATTAGPPAGRRRAAAIYGTVVTAAVVAAGGGQLGTTALFVTVLVTLVVYWLAEQYAELLGEHTQKGRLPSPAVVKASLAASWPMVTASILPLLALLVTRAAGASSANAAWCALGAAVILLMVHGYGSAKAAGLRGIRLISVTGTAGVLGIAMVVLKALVQHHHYTH